ncbi:MAG: serine acetyltransferase [Myxococcales bacterium]|nr:serine acetyltransferase [Myxococcales bacterium]
MTRDPFAELEAAIDGVAESYTGELAIDELESAALPSSRLVIEAFEHLKQALLIGFHAPRSLTPNNLRHTLSEHLYAAQEILVVQIDRALAYDRWTGGRDPSKTTRSGEDVALELMRKLPELRALLEEDVQAAFEGDPSAKSLEEVVFSYPSIDAIVAHRLAHELWVARVPMLPRIVAEHAHGRTGIDINPGARIGRRFFIHHGTGVVIGETAVIGHGVKLSQGVTLGALSIPSRDGDTTTQRHPTLEDDVTIDSGATILGGATVIGRGSVVGANVWLTESIPPGSRIFADDEDQSRS